MKEIDNLTLEEAKQVLKGISSYADMSKKLWERGKELFKKQMRGENTYVVEYFPALGQSAAWSQAEGVYAKTFHVTPGQDEVTFIEKTDVKWGMKVYCNDDMVDLSYKKVETLIQK